MSKLRDQVKEFHDAFGVPCADKPCVPDDATVTLRLKLIAEEFCELLEACGCNTVTLKDDLKDFIELREDGLDLEDFADACGDLDYVVEGARLAFGIDGEPIADAIHAANMAKLGGPIREDGKRLKPLGWAPPDIRAELVKQGADL